MYLLQGINYGRGPITTIMPVIFVIRTRRGFMDGPGSEKTWAVCKVRFEMYAKSASIERGPGACSPGKNF